MKTRDYIVLTGFILFLVVLIFTFGAEGDKPSSCTKEAKICPDGTVVMRKGPDCTFEACPSFEEGKVYCENSQRAVDACIEIYQPVCGWNDPSKVQCITYPCATTYANSCFACSDEQVLYWTEGECPSEYLE